MKNTSIVGLVLGTLFIGTSAMASTLNCAGKYIGHSFKVSGQTSGTAVVGAVHLSVAGPFHNEEGELQLSSSDIQAGRYVRFEGASADGSATLDANFRSGQTYAGTLAVAGAGGSGNISVICNLSSRDSESED